MIFPHRILVLILPAVLLIAQHGAMAHVLSHAGEPVPPAHEKTLIHLKLCGKCVSADKLSFAVPGGGVLPAATELRHTYVEPAHYARPSVPSTAYHSRAPPPLF
jgi:hypothetical protein